MINCQSLEEQLENLIAEKVKKNSDVLELGLDILALIKKILGILKPLLAIQGLAGISSLIDERIRYETTTVRQQSDSDSKPLKTESYKCNDSHFVLENWIDKPDAPLISTRINKLKRVHREILVPIVRYYKERTDDPFIRDFCILSILTGLSTDTRFQTTPVGEISHHYIGEAVNFRLTGIDDEQIIDDLRNKRIPVTPGAFGNPNGVFITLPYTVNDTRVENLYVYKDKTGSIAYEFV